MVIETIDNYIGAVANEDHDSFTEQKDFVTENLGKIFFVCLKQ